MFRSQTMSGITDHNYHVKAVGPTRMIGLANTSQKMVSHYTMILHWVIELIRNAATVGGEGFLQQPHSEFLTLPHMDERGNSAIVSQHHPPLDFEFSNNAKSAQTSVR